MQEATQNKMGIEPIRKILLKMALPMMAAMLVQAMYNVVDSIFVSRICEDALTAVSLAFPVQTLLIAFATGTGVGVNAILSRSLGCKDRETAEKAAHNGIFLAVVSYLVFLLVGIFLVPVFYHSQTDSAAITAFGEQYLSIVCVASFGVFAEIIFERLLQGCGHTLYTMYTQLCGAVLNLILDPILIFGLFGLPAMGTAGAAIATVIGQIVSGLMAIFFNTRKNREITIHLRAIRPDGKIIGEIYRVAVPSILMQGIGSVMYYGMNLILIPFTSTASAVFGVYFKLQSFVLMPIFGLNNAMVPLLAFNYGAGKRTRMLQTIKCSVLYAVAIMLFGLAVFQLFPDKLLLLFAASDDMLKIGVPALRIMCLSYVFAGYCIVVGSVFQSLGNGMYSLWVSVLRQMVVLLPVAYLLARFGGLHLVWWSFPIAEIISVAVSTLFLIRIYRKRIALVPDNA